MKNLMKKITMTVMTLALAVAFIVLNPVNAKADNFEISLVGQTENSVTIAWPVTNGVQYVVSYRPASGYNPTSIVLGNTGTYTITGLPTGYEFYAYVNGYLGSRTVNYDSIYVATKPVVNELYLYKWKSGTSTAEVEWTNNANADYVDGYDVEVYDKNGKLLFQDFNLSTSSRLDYKITSSKIKNAGFAYRVRAYFQLNETTRVYGEWSDIKRVVAQPKVSGKYRRSGGKMNVSLKWKAMKGVKSYTIYRKIGYNGKYKRIKTVKTNSFGQTGLKSSNSYYYYVVANGLKVMGKKTNSTQDQYVNVILF